MMLQDMIPYSGQYAVENPNGHIEVTNPPTPPPASQSMYDKYNIFAGNLANTKPFYKYPRNANGATDFYREDNGDIDVTIHPPTDLSFLSNLSKQGFVDIFNPNWANALLPHHPEYARLRFAETTLEEVHHCYTWIGNFMQTESWLAANTAGYLTPLANDPFFSAAPAQQSPVQAAMNDYEGSGLSIWQIAYGDVRCKSIIDATARYACYTSAPTTPPPYASFTEAENDQAWQMFQGLYGALRNRFVDKYIAETVPLNVPTDENDLLAQKYRLWFPRTYQQQANQSGMPWWPSAVPPGQGPTGGGGGGTTPTNYESQCDSYINQWKNRLLQCDALDARLDKETILTTITTRMKAVCINGANAANPYGSSNVAPTTPASVTDRSFEQIIKEVFITKGLMNSNGIYNDNYCNPFVIDWPKPYGKGPQMTGGEVTGQLDSCNCSQYRKIKTEAIAANVNVNSLPAFNVYLLQQHGDTLTPAMYNALLTKCGDPSPACICVDLNKTIDLYHVQFPNGGLDSCGSTLPIDLVVNLRTGNTPPEYVASHSIEFNAGFESGVNDQFIAYIDSTGGCDSVGMCHIRFTNFFNAHYGYNPALTWSQIDSAYWANCGHSPYVCGYKDISQTELFKVVCRFRNWDGPNTLLGTCEQNFTTFFNNYYHNVPPLTYAQIQAIYAPYAGTNPYNNVNLPADICGGKPLFCTDTIPPVNCTDSIPYIFPQPVPLPAFLKCGYVTNPRCVSCAGLSVLTGEYKTIFNSQPPSEAPIFIGTNLTAPQVSYNINFARFLNYRLGYQFGWMDYAQAAAAAMPTCNLNNYSSNNNANQNVICGDAKPLTDTTGLPKDSVCRRTYIMAVTLGQEIYRIRLQTKLAEFEAAYKAKCLSVKNTETFTVQYQTSEYHYTLYYYDQAGNLVKTVPPKGVRPNFTTAYTNQVKADRAADIDNPRPHEFITQYRYNSLNQVVAQQTPDAGISNFWYDALGRLVVSQNAQQAIDGKYSYTLYDNLGRIKEVGQKPQTLAMTQTISQNDAALDNWLNELTVGSLPKEQLTRTTYDVKADNVNPVPLDQQNLRNRVSYVQVFDNETADPFDHHAATYYTYDIHGNVDKLLQDYKGIPEMANSQTGDRFKTTEYKYDLISGKVNSVGYQADDPDGTSHPDAFYHKYEYDAENRLTQVYTSRDKIVWERDAKYEYYKHGPLARTELGQLRVQGTDYAYTIQGWLKGINNTSLNPNTDVFGDGTEYSTVAKDALSFGLHYYSENTNEDYRPIGNFGITPYNPFANIPSSLGGAVGGLYNGNIRAMSVNNAGLLKANASTNNTMPLFYSYRYDQLNRITAMQTYKGLDAATNQWTPVPITDYKEAITYDPNGNINTYNRNGATSTGTPQAMDDMGYEYIANTNKLKRVTDAVPATNYTEDIDNQTNPNNYTYSAIGNLTADVAEGISNIVWNVYGKITSITKTNGNIIIYTYDASGNRISKKLISTGIGNTVVTIYVRDASGNVMSVYEYDQPIGSEAGPTQTEIHLYGSSRLGILNQLTEAPVTIVLNGGFGNAKLSTFTRGEKIFELSNHLGNVLVTVDDRKIPFDTNGDGIIDYYTSDVISAGDYAPGGMTMPGRKYQAGTGSYRYGQNGQERDKELNENIYTAEYWEYDARLVRRWNVDPILKTWESPYLCFSGNPIIYADPNGDDANSDGGKKKKKGSSASKKNVADAINNAKNDNSTTATAQTSTDNGVSAPLDKITNLTPTCLGCPIMSKQVVNDALVGTESITETVKPSLNMNNIGSKIKDALQLTGAGILVDNITGTETTTTSRFSNDKKQLIVETQKIVTQFNLIGGDNGNFSFTLTQSTTDYVDYYSIGEQNRGASLNLSGKNFNVTLIKKDNPITAVNDVDFMNSSFNVTDAFASKFKATLDYNNAILKVASSKFTEAQAKELLKTAQKIVEKLSKKAAPPSKTIK